MGVDFHADLALQSDFQQHPPCFAENVDIRCSGGRTLSKAEIMA